VSIVTRLQARLPGFDSRQGKGFFSLPPLPGLLEDPAGIQRPKCEGGYSSLSNGEVKNAPCVFVAWV